MLKKLQQKWKVSLFQLILILCTFIIGGSICGRLAALLLNLFLSKSVLWWILYVFFATILWPICVITVSIPFGQFTFFSNYLKKIKSRMFGN